MGRPKQFIELLGHPALHHTLRAFEESSEISRIYAVGDCGRIRDLAAEAGISKYAGCTQSGSCRSFSTRNGLGICDEDPETLVLIHDGSRCLVTPDLVARVVGAMDDGTDGAVPALPVSDTIKVAEDGMVHETLDRNRLHAVQTPQAFRLGLLREIFSASEDEILDATDDASLVERNGGRVALVPGEKTNIKLTSPEDLILAEAILIARSRIHNGGSMAADRQVRI